MVTSASMVDATSIPAKASSALLINAARSMMVWLNVSPIGRMFMTRTSRYHPRIPMTSMKRWTLRRSKEICRTRTRVPRLRLPRPRRCQPQGCEDGQDHQARCSRRVRGTFPEPGSLDARTHARTLTTRAVSVDGDPRACDAARLGVHARRAPRASRDRRPPDRAIRTAHFAYGVGSGSRIFICFRTAPASGLRALRR